MVLLQSVLPFMGIVIGLVVLHELGHLVAAKLAGVRVEEFGVGMPPRIWGKKFGETTYTLNWLPLGGFVRLTGEESPRVYVDDVNDHSVAARAGLRPHDVITKVDDDAVHNEKQLAALLQNCAVLGSAVLTIEREEPGQRGPELSEYEIDLVFTSAGDAPAAVDADIPAATVDADSAAATLGRIAGIGVGPDPRSLGSKSRRVRIAVMAAGAAVNAVLPILLFAIAAMIPQDQAAGPAVVTSVIDGSPAQQAGLQPGDRFISINGDTVRHATAVATKVQVNVGRDIDIVIERDVLPESVSQRSTIASTEIIELTVHARLAPQRLQHTVLPGEDVHDVAQALGLNASQVLASLELGPRYELDAGHALELPGGVTYITQPGDTPASIGRDLGFRNQVVLAAAGIDLVNLAPGTQIDIRQGPTGIGIGNASRRVVSSSEGVFSAIGSGWDRTIETLTIFRNRIRTWIAGGEGIAVAGPVGLAQLTGDVVKQAGWLRLIEFAALISINLAIINILPLPMLDGGRIAFVLLEIVRRGKRISPEREGLVHLTGFALMILFAIVISFFDIARIIDGESVLR